MKRSAIAALLLLALCARVHAGDDELPRNAEDIEYPISYWAPPEAFEYLRELPGEGALFLVHANEAREVALEAVVTLPGPESALTATVLGRLLARSGPEGGTPQDFQRMLLDRGARFDVQLDRACLVLGIAAPPDRFAEVLEAFLETIKKPRWDDAELAVLRARMTSDMALARPDEDDWTEVFWTTAGKRSGLITWKGLEAVDLAALKGFHESHMHLSKLVFSLSGPARETAILPFVQKHLLNLPPPKKTGNAPKPRDSGFLAGLRIHGIESDLAEVKGAFPAWSGRGAGAPALHAAFQILSRRFQRRIRTNDLYMALVRTGWEYDPAGNAYATVRFKAPVGQAAGILRILFEEGARLGEDDTDPAEVSEALDALKRLSRLDFGWPRAKARTLALERALKDAGQEGAFGGIIRVSREEIREAAKRHFDPVNFSALAWGPEGPLTKELEYAGLKEKGLRITEAKALDPYRE